MTSRAEYRLLLRQDNADQRLTEKGYRVGLVSEERYQRYKERKQAIEDEISRLEKTIVTPSIANPFLNEIGSSEINRGVSLAQLLRRSEITYDLLEAIDPERIPLSRHVKTTVQVNIKYEGYISKQLAQIERFKKLEDMKLPEDLDYNNLHGLRIEARQKLSNIRPRSIGQASRISGVSPADINVLLIHLERMNRK
jgi:tRNA uridine 5-carboxymethylaminomethyl modification enzyme